MTKQEEIAFLREKLRVRENMAGYAKNSKAIRARIAVLEGENG